MLISECFRRDWIEAQARVLNTRALELLEKSIVALQLVGHLAEADFPFQFKGGTSLLLLVNPIRRLSIDVDIVTQATRDQLNRVLESVGRLPPFQGIVHDPQRDRDLPPKSHYRAHYPSAFPPYDGHILLDVLFEPAPTAALTVIRTPFIQTAREVRVLVPGVNGLLGDKLTAFAPKTIGILEHPERAGEVVKQLFDIAILFDAATDLSAAAAAYTAIHGHQCRYRQPYTLEATLDDTIDACLALALNELRGPAKGNELGNYLKTGIERLQNHLVNGQFARAESDVAAAKAACAAAIVRQRATTIDIQSLRFEQVRKEELATASMEQPWQPLLKLKRINLEAFFYWRRARQILSGEG